MRGVAHTPPCANAGAPCTAMRAGASGLAAPAGCDHCGGHGLPRPHIHELMLADDAVRRLIRHRDDAGALRTAALAAGMKTLRQDGIAKVLAGHRPAEVLAATNA